LYEPLNKLSASGTSFAGAREQVRRVFDVLDRDPIIADAADAAPLPRQARTLALEHVWFEYRDGAPVLQDIDVTIEPGQMVAFVGSSGVGKTTLLNLLPRFYDPTRGALKLDGLDARRVKIRDLRKHVALVLQEGVILPASVAENIAYGRPDSTDAQIRKAADLAGAASFIEKLPEKYDTQISESGGNLSGGQRQRIAIARALITEAPIMVLDEPTSALDPQHEQMITETLRDLKRSRTIILVSHRLSTVADCDQIFVMDEGRIVERGTHDALIAKRGLYFGMAKHQMKLEREELATTDERR
jgi:subfamily B ATP-binding cassette protein MsbA